MEEIGKGRFEYANNAETLPVGFAILDITEMSDEQEKLVVKDADKRIDSITGKDIRMMPGGMTVWYMIEALAFTDTCTKIAREMRGTRNYNEQASSIAITELEGDVAMQNYELTVSEWLSHHHQYCAEVYRLLNIDESSLYSRLPACILHRWKEKSEKYDC